jgi:hypothetical protein
MGQCSLWAERGGEGVYFVDLQGEGWGMIILFPRLGKGTVK